MCLRIVHSVAPSDGWARVAERNYAIQGGTDGLNHELPGVAALPLILRGRKPVVPARGSSATPLGLLQGRRLVSCCRNGFGALATYVHITLSLRPIVSSPDFRETLTLVRFRLNTALRGDTQIGILATPFAKSLKHALNPKRQPAKSRVRLPRSIGDAKKQCANLTRPPRLSCDLRFLANLAPPIGQ